MSRRKQHKPNKGAKRQQPRQRPHGQQPQPTNFVPSGPVSTYGAADDSPMPEIAEGLTATPMQWDGEDVVLHVPTAALIKVSEIADAEGLTLSWPSIEDAPVAFAVREDAAHPMTQLTRITGEDGTDFVRCLARLILAPEATSWTEGTRAWQGWMDLPTRYVGMMLEASRPRIEPQPQTVGVEYKPTAGTAPRWAGSYTFDRVFDAQVRYAAGDHRAVKVGERMILEDPRMVLAMEAQALLREGHLLRVEADQVELLPDWDDPADAYDFAHDLHLPFEPLYLEFEGPGGIAPVHAVAMNLIEDWGGVRETASAVIVLRSAIVSRNEDGELAIVPFGDVFLREEGQSVEDARRGKSSTPTLLASGHVSIGHRVFSRFEAASAGSPVGKQRLVSLNDAGDQMMEAHPVAMSSGLFTDGKIPGVVSLPFSQEEADEAGWGVKESVAWGSALMSMALRTLAVLSILESEAVVVDEAVMENRDRKRAEKRGWNISSQVFVRPTRKSPKRVAERTGEAPEREYSHRFWVSGHYKHFPLGTRVADARPDLVKPCTRSGAASCGVCRRVWTAPFLKGPEDKPVVLKSLVRRGAHGEVESGMARQRDAAT